MPNRLLLLGLTVAVSGTIALGDAIVLKNGTRLSGDVTRSGDYWLVTDDSGQILKINPADVQAIEKTPGAGPASPDAAMNALASLRRSVQAVDDPKVALDKYARFLEQYGDTPAADEARKDIAIWKDRSDKGMVRFGSQWMSPDERAQQQAKSIAIAQEARQLIKQNRMREAETVVRSALQTDPNNASALYLLAVLEYTRGAWPAARKAFESVDDIVPNHAPTLNNLAVVAWRQNQWGAAMLNYDKAMQAAPEDERILSNFAEALHAMPDDARRSQVARAAIRRYEEQEARLVPKMMEKGLHRWGSGWVNQEEFERLRAAEDVIKQRLDALAVQFDQAKARIDDIDREIASIERSMRQLEARSYVQDIHGRFHRRPLPDLYYDLGRDIDILRTQRAQEIARMDSMKLQAKQIQQELPKPRYSGVQQIVGAEGTPLVPPG
jgi:tetratricopeptide (TPR) repeat protein